jgi:enamine deaminase RidA (YjgF/YER057c/UK114 family)
MSDQSSPDHLPSNDLAAGVPYSYAAVARDRSVLVFTAGACPLDGAGATVAPGDVVGQAGAAMGNLRAALESAGARLDDVVKITVYVASNQRSDLTAAWSMVHHWFGAHEPPATLLGVSVLGYTDQLVEVEAVASLTS